MSALFIRFTSLPINLARGPTLSAGQTHMLPRYVTQIGRLARVDLASHDDEARRAQHDEDIHANSLVYPGHKAPTDATV